MRDVKRTENAKNLYRKRKKSVQKNHICFYIKQVEKIIIKSVFYLADQMSPTKGCRVNVNQNAEHNGPAYFKNEGIFALGLSRVKEEQKYGKRLVEPHALIQAV